MAEQLLPLGGFAGKVALVIVDGLATPILQIRNVGQNSQQRAQGAATFWHKGPRPRPRLDVPEGSGSGRVWWVGLGWSRVCITQFQPIHGDVSRRARLICKCVVQRGSPPLLDIWSTADLYTTSVPRALPAVCVGVCFSQSRRNTGQKPSRLRSL